MQICHDSQDLRYRSPFGAVCAGDTVTLNLYAPGCLGASVRLWQEGKGETMVSMTQSAALFTAKIQVPKEPCLLWYFFVANYGEKIICYGNNPESLGGEGCVYENSQPPSFQITVYDPFTSPAWYKDALVYQIFPDRFARGADYEERRTLATLPDGWSGPSRTFADNWYQLPHYQKDDAGDVTAFDFFGGTLNGIREKIPYLKSLGVTALYLNPIFKAASNHRYDTADYMSIDPLLGDDKIFASLCEKCRANGIRIILDGVFSHTGADSIYFDKYQNYEKFGSDASSSCTASSSGSADAAASANVPATTRGAYHHEDSPYRSWYRFKDEAPGYECWWGVSDLPNVEETDPSYEKYICGDDGVIKKWLGLGASGFRLDVADELPDTFIRSVHDAVKSASSGASAFGDTASQADASLAEASPDNLLLGEVWEDASNKYSYSALRSYFSGHELDGVMNYPFRDHAIDYCIGKESAEMFARKMKSLQENYPAEAFYSSFNLIGGHDCERILSVLGSFTPAGDNFTREDGTFVPAGSALPLEGYAYELARARLKMLSSLQYAMPGVPCVYYGDEAGVQGSKDPDNRRTYPWGREDGDILYHYRMLGLIYRTNPVLRSGRFALTHKDNCLFVLRADDHDMILTVINASTEKKYFTETLTGLFGSEYKHRFFTYALELLNSKVVPVTENALEIGIAGTSAMIIKLQKEAPKPLELNRATGILCHLSSLPEIDDSTSPAGASSANTSPANFDTLCAGALGKKGRAFIDWLADSGFKLWQMLPVNPAGAGNSPYFSPCVFAGDTRYIDWTELPSDDGFDAFREENAYWLSDWATHCRAASSAADTLSAANTSTADLSAASSSAADTSTADSSAASSSAANASTADSSAASSSAANTSTASAAPASADNLHADVDPEHAQYYFFTQLKALRAYANSKGIALIGDLPIYAAPESVDVKAHPESFQLDEDGRLLFVGGVPPDYFSETGQYWSNPLYRWDHMKENNYEWWYQRLRQALGCFDYIRLDHFRSFSEYFAIPEGRPPVEGTWQQGPGMDFFRCMKERLGALPIIAEDLGLLDSGVFNLLKETGFPGMNIWQFSADEMQKMDSRTIAHRIFYSGTHDNQTLVGWCASEFPDEDAREKAHRIIETLMTSKAPWVIFPLQDILLLDDDARLNIPGTTCGNWTWKCDVPLPAVKMER